ncbi:MAG: hypothetical protein FJ253_02730 [Phycisphaerae bacterium]|nr:hypothetical protein [Phycisphaerae bacterium]
MSALVARSPGMHARALTALAVIGALAVGEWCARRGDRHATDAAAVPSVRPIGPRSLAGAGIAPAAESSAGASSAMRASPAPGVAFDPDPVSTLRADQARSIERVMGELDARFHAWRERSDRFADSLLSWGTRGRLAWRMVRGAVGGDGAADGSQTDGAALVRDRFESMVMRNGEVDEAVRVAAERMALELRADRSRALARVRHRMAWREGRADAGTVVRSALPTPATTGPLEAELLRAAERSLGGGVLAVVGATIVTEVVAVSVGAAAGGAALGAASGSVVPGAGTAVGFAAGLGAGIAVDWWMHARTRDEVVKRCAAAIDELRSAIVDGDGSEERPGLRAIFERIAEQEARDFERELAGAKKRGGA